MRILTEKRCIIGEGPVWNAQQQRLYFTNGLGGEICICDPYSGELEIRPVKQDVAAMAFTKTGDVLLSRADGVFFLDADKPLNTEICHANDMKVGPDGRLYVGTQSQKRLGRSDAVDGKLYRVDADGTAEVLLDGLRLSNGMDWSWDEKRFYHTDSDTHILREYEFDAASGIRFTGRQVEVPGVDGFCTGENGDLYCACWGRGHIAVVDASTVQVKAHIPVPTQKPASCGFCGKHMELLAVTTASFKCDLQQDPGAGFTFLADLGVCGREPYLFG